MILRQARSAAMVLCLSSSSSTVGAMLPPRVKAGQPDSVAARDRRHPAVCPARSYVVSGPLLLLITFTRVGAELSTHFPVRQYQDSTAQREAADSNNCSRLSTRNRGYRNRQSEAAHHAAMNDSDAPIGRAGKAGPCKGRLAAPRSPSLPRGHQSTPAHGTGMTR